MVTLKRALRGGRQTDGRESGSDSNFTHRTSHHSGQSAERVRQHGKSNGRSRRNWSRCSGRYDGCRRAIQSAGFRHVHVSAMTSISFTAAVCYFLLSFGTVWLLSERGSDWGTERWGDGVRAMLLLIAVFAWIVLFTYAGNSLAGVERIPDEGLYPVAVALGVPSGLLGYWLYRRFLFPRSQEEARTDAEIPFPEPTKPASLLDRLLIERRMWRKSKRKSGE